MTISRCILSRMRNVSDKSCREGQNTHFMFSVFSENRAVYEIMWRVEGGVGEKDNAQLRLHRNSGCGNAPRCYMIRTLLIVFVLRVTGK